MSVQCKPRNLTIEYTGKKRTRWLCTVEADHTLDDVLAPEYFGAIAHSGGSSGGVRIGDIIELDWEDETKFGELKVRSIPKGMAQMICVLRSFTQYDESDFPAGWEARWKGSTDHYALVRDGKEVECGFLSETDAAVRAHALVAQEQAGSAVRNAVPKKRAPARKTAPKAKETEDA